jgi:phage-related minor tail protein
MPLFKPLCFNDIYSIITASFLIKIMRQISLITFLFLLVILIMPTGLLAETTLLSSGEAKQIDDSQASQSLTQLKAPKQIESLLEEKRQELTIKKKEYRKAKKSLKEAARTGFFGFGRSQEETQVLVEAKERASKLKRGINALKREINLLKKELNLAKKIKILRERQKEINNLF